MYLSSIDAKWMFYFTFFFNRNMHIANNEFTRCATMPITTGVYRDPQGRHAVLLIQTLSKKETIITYAYHSQ